VAEPSPTSINLRAGAVFVVLTAAVLASFFWFERTDRAAQKQLATAMSSQLALRVQNFLADRLRAVEALAERLSDRPAVTEARFRALAAAPREVLPGFQALNWVDDGGVIRWVTPREGNAAAVGARLFEHPTTSPFIAKAETDSDLHATFPVPLLQGGQGFVAYRRVVRDERTLGYLNAVFRLNAVMDRVFPDRMGDVYGVRLTDGDVELYSLLTKGASWQAAPSVDIRVADRTWTLRVAPVYRVANVNWLILAGGIVLAAAVSLAMRSQLMNQYRLARSEQRLSAQTKALRQSSAALRAAHDDLEARVAERTKELRDEIATRKAAESELTAAMERAEHANRVKTEFLAHMSHELRTPLNAVIGFSEIWMNETFGRIDNPKYKEYAEVINASGKHLLDVVNDILDLSKVEAGETAVEPSPNVLLASVRAAVTLLADQAARKDIDLAVEDEAPGLTVDLDARLWKQVLINLIGNAVKFSPPKASVTVRCARQADGGARVAIADTGPGIAPDDQRRVLEPFAQARTRIDIAHEGTGLGLSLSRRYMELHGGALNLDSTPGAGTTVTVTFPPSRVVAPA
jgi:signal transduction histidine kinase